MSLTPEKDAPMPPGVEAMTKQQLWNWFHRSTQAAAEQLRLREKFFTMTTGLHSARSFMLGDPPAIIEAQRARMRGLELQMAQMQKGYDKTLRKAVAAATTPGNEALSLLRRVRNGCLTLDGSGKPTFDPTVERALYDEICSLLLEDTLQGAKPGPRVSTPAGQVDECSAIQAVGQEHRRA